MHRFMSKVSEETVDEETIKKQKKNNIKYITVFEYFLLVTMISMSFYFISFLWAICLGFVFICLQIMKVVDWLTIRDKINCDICHKNIIGEKNEEK